MIKARLILSLILSVLLVSCSINKSTGDASNTASHEAMLIANLNTIVDGWNNQDPAKLGTYVAGDFVRTSHGKPHFKSRAGYVELMRTFSSSFPDQKVVLNSTAVKGNQVFTNWTVSGTNTGAFLGNPATGTHVDIRGFSVWTFDNNGVLTREDAYWNDMDTLTQLGYTVSAKK
jgi:steroid delta-isomerase-like uncharacterized protein